MDAKKEKKRMRWALIILGALFALFLTAGFSGLFDDDKAKSSNAGTNNTNTSPAQKQESDIIGIGQVLSTKYFDITLNSAHVSNRVQTGSQFTDIQPQQGHLYLTLNVSYKNTSRESQAVNEGEVLIDYNGKRYEFDNTEIIAHEGWGFFLDQINPLTSITTNLVYKIPAEIKGNAYYKPALSHKKQVIFIGNIK